VLEGLPQVGQTNPGWVGVCSLLLSADVARSEGREPPRVRLRLLEVCSGGKDATAVTELTLVSHLQVDLGSC
jgi:hypothetical protein